MHFPAIIIWFMYLAKGVICLFFFFFKSSIFIFELCWILPKQGQKHLEHFLQSTASKLTNQYNKNKLIIKAWSGL